MKKKLSDRNVQRKAYMVIPVSVKWALRQQKQKQTKKKDNKNN